MVSLTTIRTHNASLKTLSPGLVAVFVGGTSGIGLSTAREFVRNTNSPHIYLIGRNQTEASRIIDELHELNPSSQLSFIKSDISLLKSVDEVCKEIKEKESKVNLLFLTAGYLTFKGRDETTEGLDRKFSLHYYARMRFIQGLSPLLAAAANDSNPSANLSRAVSVLDPHLGTRWTPNFEDLSLKRTFSLKNCATHGSVMNNLALEEMAKAHPGTSFVHAYPSGVATGLMRAQGPVLNGVWKAASLLMKPFLVPIGESGERHLFAATAPRFAPKSKAEGVQDLEKGSDGVKGSGSYWLNWDGEVLGESKKMVDTRTDDAGKKIWEHTEEVFRKICEEGGRY
ncbi:NAD(P)-binding protein [Zopfia rhizophila CBS 207.26]|uniref:NAD(P)-binding protein n=1 Tax=Zopfia rhizophila CBS 207.26 TaxID=1314779 RepID=A0A6A6EPJ4_9PEZI|nr:NAD(P)-binding protein [Zopfia rhizophila CBS 207.26]